MDFNSVNKNNGKRKAQSIQDMINSPSTGIRGIGKSGYSGPKKSSELMGGTNSPSATGRIDLSAVNINDSGSAGRWGNSNVGMPEAKRPRVKADVPNPMRGNFLKNAESGVKSSIARNGSGYTGPKAKPMSAGSFLENATRSLEESEAAAPQRGGYVAKSYSTPIDDYGWIIFSGLLFLAVTVTLLASGLKPRNNNFTYPLNIFSMSGVINEAYEHALGISSSIGSTSESYSLASDADSTITTDNSGTKTVQAAGEGDLKSLGADAEAVTLDDGSKTFSGYTQASTHSELVSQIETALAANDVEFIGAKIAYEDENTGSLNGYPLSLVKHFSEYMATNSDKRSSFISTIGSDEYAATNGSANVVKLPVMKFTVKMGESTDTFVLDNTIVSVSGFSDVIVNGNQQAAIYPLLPCMYTVTLTNNAWPTPSQSQEIEATLGEGNLEIKVGN